jgi:epoxyqueuosine reductase
MMLLHVCCSDCGLKMLDAIKKLPNLENEEVHFYFYNPNIHPQSEFTARQIALKKVTDENKIKLIVANWTPDDYFMKVGLTDCATIKVRSIRCPICWEVRLAKTFAFAKIKGYQSVSTTLLSSKYMERDTIIKIAKRLEKSTGIRFFQPEKINFELKTTGFYKQNYCGCIYSLIERMQEKYGSGDKRN